MNIKASKKAKKQILKKSKTKNKKKDATYISE